MPTAIPEVIGRYQVLKSIGEGGMGALYLARDPAIDRLVAIKLLREGFDTAELRQRFTSEARSAGRLHHQNIVTIFDVGEHDRQPFIAMEYIKGQTLSELTRHDANERRASVSLARKLDWMDKLFAGLYYAHRAGVIHRDIKPANIMIDEEGILKILDFGIARFGASEMTQAGMIIGTLNYMAPEQMMGRPVDARADIFSVGAVFYEVLTHRRAFPGDLSSGIVHKILSGQPEALETVIQDLDPAVIAVVSRCLEKDADKRYPDLGVARRELASVRNRIATEDFADWGPTVTMPTPGVDTPAPVHTPTPGRGRQRGSDRQELLRLRAEQIEAHLKEATAAFERGEFEASRRSCQHALLLDPENRAVLELEERTQARLEQKHVKEWLDGAHQELERGALTAASLLVDRALSLSESSPEAVRVREAIDEARRELAEAQERARQLEAALRSAKQHLASGALDEASAAVAEALALDPHGASAIALREQVQAAIAAKKKAEEDARAKAVVDSARRTFAAGKIEAALEMLSSFAPAHPQVTSTLGELQIEANEIERRRKIEKERREIAQKFDEASARLRDDDVDGALAAVKEILAREPQHQEALALKKKAEAALEQRRQVAEHVASARTLLEQKKYQLAIAAVGKAAALDPHAAGLAEIRREAENGLEAEAAARVQREIDGHLSSAAKALDAKDYPRALDHVQSALRIEPNHKAATALTRKIEKAIAESQAEKAKAVLDDKTIVIKAPAPPQAGEQTVKIQTPVAPPVPSSGEQTMRLPQPAAPTVVVPVKPPAPAPPAPQPMPEQTVVLPSKRAQPAPAAADLQLQQDIAPAVPSGAGGLSKGVMAALAAGVLLLVVIGVLVMRGGQGEKTTATNSPGAQTLNPPGGQTLPPAVVAAPVPVVLNVLPWAKIDAVTRRSDNTAVNVGDVTTPSVLMLPPGDYHVRASNPGFPALEFDFTVGAGGTGGAQEIQKAMPGFELESEINQILK